MFSLLFLELSVAVVGFLRVIPHPRKHVFVIFRIFVSIAIPARFITQQTLITFHDYHYFSGFGMCDVGR